MLRLVKGRSEQEVPEGTYPIHIVRDNKRWIRNTGCDTLEKLDCNSLNLIHVLESSRPWERLKLQIMCSICHDSKVGRPWLEGFHWIYLHCRDCPEYFACADCVVSQERDNNPHNEDHDLIILQSRPFSSPSPDGRELQQLEALRGAKTADDFFLYFPWFFHSFLGIDEIVQQSRAALQAEIQRNAGGGDEDVTGFVSNCAMFPVDWYFRCFGMGIWKMLYRSFGPTIDARIQVAKTSTALYELLGKLRSFVDAKESRYGNGDIPPIIPPQYEGFSAFSSTGKGVDYVKYTFPLHFLTVLDKDINQRRIREILPSDEQIVTELENTLNPGLPEFRRLWPMFQLFFEDHPEFKDLLMSRAVSDLGGPHLEYMLPETLEYLPHPRSSARPVREELSACQRKRILGNFEEAIRDLKKMDLSDPEVLLQIQLTYLEQGYLNKALECRGLVDDVALELLSERLSMLGMSISTESRTARRLPEQVRVRCKQLPLTLFFLDITAKYAACFVKGAWEAALDTADQAFTKYCTGEKIDTPTEEGDMLRIRIELISHRIFLETYRDLGLAFPAEDAAARAHSIWRSLCGWKPDPLVAEVAWDALSLELEIRKRPVRDQYLEMESAFSLSKFVPTPAVAIPLLTEFKHSRILDSQDPVLGVFRGRAEFLLAELHFENGDVALSRSCVELAKASFKEAGCVSDLLDIAILDTRIENSPTFSRIDPIYQELCSQNDIKRMRIVRRMYVDHDERSGLGLEWQMYQRESLRDLAREAGDNIVAQRWSLRKYPSDYQVAASVLPAEAVLGGEVVQSTRLATLASFNLSKAYTTLGNYFSAALSAMLHLSLVNTMSDVESCQRAILEVLRIFTATVTADPAAEKKKLLHLARFWNGWLEDGAICRWYIGAIRCDEIDRFIDGACFLPLLVGQVSRWEEGVENLAHDYDFELSLVNNLRLAFKLYEAAPTYLASVMVPKLSLALGATAAYFGNPELAIRCYWVGICSCHSADLYTISLLRLEAGKQMTLLAERDPEHWLHLVSPGRSLLQAAADGFKLTRTLSGSILKRAESTLYLSVSYMAETRARKFVLDACIASQETVTVDKLAALALVTHYAQESLESNTLAFKFIAMNLELGTADKFSDNLARLAENRFLCETRQLSLELALITGDFNSVEKENCREEFWNVVQRSKGTVIGYHYGRLLPSKLLDKIQASPEAWRLYLEERRLIEQGPVYTGDSRLLLHRAQMAECEELVPLLERRFGQAVSMSALSVMVNELVGETRNIIMIDWIQYRDYFCIIGYNARTQKLSIFNTLTSLPVTEIEDWVAQTLRVNDADLPHALNTAEKFKPLWPLTEEIHKSCNPGDILVFCPSKVLNSIPLHAIPYKNKDDQPIIHYHPIVYAPSNTVLKECVERALADGAHSSSLRASFFCRYPENQETADTSIKEMQAILDENNVQTTVTSGSAVTHAALKEQFANADFLHLHGHTAGHDLERHLVLETEDFTDSSFLPGSAAQYTARAGITPFLSTSEVQRASQERTQKFTPQDAFAVPVRARIVMLMGCGSGIQVIRQGDDALGLVNSFLSAGATSVMATLWPLDQTDAARFSNEFYRNMFATVEEHGHNNHEAGLIDLATAFQRSVNFMRACTRPKCLRKSLSARLQCHRVAPYHWAPFTLSGSWVCRGVPSAHTE